MNKEVIYKVKDKYIQVKEELNVKTNEFELTVHFLNDLVYGNCKLVKSLFTKIIKDYCKKNNLFLKSALKRVCYDIYSVKVIKVV